MNDTDSEVKMFLNINALGYDLELKFRKKEHPAPKVIVIQDDQTERLVSDLCKVLW